MWAGSYRRLKFEAVDLGVISACVVVITVRWMKAPMEENRETL